MLDQLKSNNKIIDALLGVAIGDAVGVPYEFRSEDRMKADPCKEMIGYGTHNQPPGTWSDDSSLTFCLAESLTGGYDLKDIAKTFILWKSTAYWTAHDQVFDIGMTTSKSITALVQHLEIDALDGYLATNGEFLNQVSLIENGNFKRISIVEYFCDPDCAYKSVNDIPLYFDSGHLTLTGSLLLEKAFSASIGVETSG